MTDLVHIDDLEVPRFSPEVEEIRGLMSTMAADCPLDADALHAKARAETGLDDFGADDYRERLDAPGRRLRRHRRTQRTRASSTSTCSCSSC